MEERVKWRRYMGERVTWGRESYMEEFVLYMCMFNLK